MPPTPPLPTVIGRTENSLRALLTQILASTRIETYPAWVVLNGAASGDADDSKDDWRRAASDALKVEASVVDAVVAQLVQAGLVSANGAVTAEGAAELATARPAVAKATALLMEGVSEEEQAATRRVLEHVRDRADVLLRQ